MRLFFLQTTERPQGELWGVHRWHIAAMVRRSSVPSEGDLFGLLAWDKGPIVTERFKRFAEGVLANAEFVEIPVIDE